MYQLFTATSRSTTAPIAWYFLMIMFLSSWKANQEQRTGKTVQLISNVYVIHTLSPHFCATLAKTVTTSENNSTQYCKLQTINTIPASRLNSQYYHRKITTPCTDYFFHAHYICNNVKISTAMHTLLIENRFPWMNCINVLESFYSIYGSSHKVTKQYHTTIGKHGIHGQSHINRASNDDTWQLLSL